jgi:hypothetical protein
MEFETEAVFEATIDPRSLREARRTVEDEVGDLPVDVQMQASAGGAGGSRDWDIEHDLSRERNQLLRRLVDANEQGNFDRALRGGGGALGGLVGGGALALGLGAAGLAGALGGLGEGLSLNVPDIPPLPVPNIPPLDIPSIPPLEVPSIPPLDVPNIPPLEIPEIDPIPVNAPEAIPLVPPDDTPSGSGEGSGTGEGTGGDSGAPDGLPVTPPELNPPEVVGGAAAAGAGALAAREAARRLSGGGLGGTPSAAAPFAAPAIVAGDVGRRADEQPADQRNIIERFFANLRPNLGGTTAATAALTSSSGNRAEQNRPVNINATSEARVEGVGRREAERIAERKAQEMADEIRRNLSGRGF